MSSRFFRGDSDSESETDSDESILSEEEDQEEEQQQQKVPAHFQKPQGRRAVSDSDDSDEDTVRVVKSAKDKRFEELRAAVKSIDNAKKINDWVAIHNDFEKLNKAINKASNIIRETGGAPRFYIRALAQLEDFLKETQEKGTVKKMNALNAKGFNAMKQKLRKHNKLYEEKIADYKKNPVESDDDDKAGDDDDDESSGEDEPIAAAPASKKKTKAPKKVESDDDSDSEWPSDSESESESDSDKETGKGAGRAFWTRKDTTKKPAKPEVSKQEKPKPATAAAVAADAEGDDGFIEVGKSGKPVVELSNENFFKRLAEVVEARGKKSTDRADQIRTLQKLLAFAPTPYSQIKVLLALISSQFDSNPSMTGYMNLELWKNALSEINALFTLLETHTHFNLLDECEEPDLENMKPEDVTTTDVRGSVMPFVSRLDDEWTKSLQTIDPHTTDYVDRLRDEVSLYACIVRAQAYHETRKSDAETVSGIVMRRVEHLYYKPDAVTQLCESAASALLPKSIAAHMQPEFQDGEASFDSEKLIHRLCVFLYGNAQPLHRTRALLCHVYHHALHGKFYVARDMMLMSHLQESIHNADIATQILYNRTMAQLGICAFRNGLIRESLACLLDISATGRVKELLAQGIQMQRNVQITPEQEKIEKQRQLPFHMHINLELLECIFLFCSMLLEIPNMAKYGSSSEARKRAISKPFKRMLDYSERQVFSGPPENTRDHVMAASKALSVGEWEKCRDMILSIKIWELMPGFDALTPMLTLKIQQEGLRTYLFTYSAHYASVSIEHLSTSFDLPATAVHAVVAKMIHTEELAASLDETRTLVILHRADLSRTQSLALTFADKASAFVEANERTIEYKMSATEEDAEGNTGGARHNGFGGRGGGRGGRGGGNGSGNGGRGGNRGGRGGYARGGGRRTFDSGLGNKLPHRDYRKSQTAE